MRLKKVPTAEENKEIVDAFLRLAAKKSESALHEYKMHLHTGERYYEGRLQGYTDCLEAMFSIIRGFDLWEQYSDRGSRTDVF